jgi:hypothetical protein
MEFAVIPGNHDCFLSEEKEELRRVIVTAAEKLPSAERPDRGICSDLLSAQDSFFKFSAAFGAAPTEWDSKLCSHRMITLCGKVIWTKPLARQVL